MAMKTDNPRDKAIQVLEEIMEDKGAENYIRISAAVNLLDRVSEPEPKDLESIVMDEIDSFFEWLREAKLLPEGSYDKAAIFNQYWNRDDEGDDTDG